MKRPQPTATTADTPSALTATHPFVVNLRRKLERWELHHLRQLTCDQADKIDLLECNLTRETDRANYWQAECTAIIEQLQEAGKEVGLSVDGEILLGAA